MEEISLSVVFLCSIVHFLAALYGMYILAKYEDVFTGNSNLVLNIVHLVIFINFIINSVFLYKFDLYLINPCYCISFSVISGISMVYYTLANKYLRTLKD